MDLLKNCNFDSCILVCNKEESQQSFVELLFESKKRSGGDDILQIFYDKLLKQFLIIYHSPEIAKNVLDFGQITYNNQTYIAKSIDKSKLILENLDERLEKDVIELYAYTLFQDVEDCHMSIEILKPGYAMLLCNKEFDIEKIKKRHAKHNKLQNKDITLHLVAKLDKSFDVSFKSCEYFNFYLNIFNSTNQGPSSILQSVQTSNLNPIDEISSIEETNNQASNLQDKITNLEKKLKIYENLNDNLNRINKLTECALRLNNEQPDRTSPIQVRSLTNSTQSCSRLNSDSNFQVKFNSKKEEKINRFLVTDLPVQENPVNDSQRSGNIIRVRDNIQKLMIEEHRRFEQANLNTEDSEYLNNIVPCKANRTLKCSLNNNSQKRGLIPLCTPVSSSSFSPPQIQSPNQLLRAYCQLNSTMINRFPIIKYKKPKMMSLRKNENEIKSEEDTGEDSKVDLIDDGISVSTRCSICLEDLIENDDVRILSCFHQFHVKCIDTWLGQKSTCPTCKLNLFNSLNDQ